MQSAGYRSGYYNSGISIVAASGHLEPQFNGSAFCRGAEGYSILRQPPCTDQCLSYNKDLLRDVMLKHEAIFQYQIHELHHLYERQRQLMGELQMRNMPMNGSVSQLQCDVSRTALGHNPHGLLSNFTDVKPHARGLINISKASTFVCGSINQMGSEDLCTTGNDCKELEASSSRENKFRKRLLDLELADAPFTKSDEGEHSEANRESVLHDPSRNKLDSSNKNSMDSSDGNSTMLNLSGQRMNCVFDLNEPVQVNESTNSTSSIYSNLSHKEIMEQGNDYDPSGSSRLKSPVLNVVVQSIPEQKGEQGISFVSGNQVSFFGRLPLTNNNGVGLHLETARNAEDLSDFNGRRVCTSPMTDSSSLVLLSGDINIYSRTATGRAGFKRECLSPDLNAACSPSHENATFHVYGSIEDQSTNEHHSISSNLRSLDCTKSVVDLNLNVMPSYSSPDIEASLEKINFNDGMANLDLNVVPSSPLSEMEVLQEKAESINYSSCHDSSLVHSNEIGDNPDVVVHRISLESRSSSSPLTAHTSLSSPSNSFENEHIQNREQVKMPNDDVPCFLSHESEKCGKEDIYLRSQSGKEHSRAETYMPLPFTFREELPLTPAVANGVETVILAPHGPDGEPSPPREGSEENKSTLEESKEGLDRIAAETIISMSLSGKRQFHKNCTGHLEASVDCLDWFAGIISAATGYLENESEDSDAPVGNCNRRILNSVVHAEVKAFKSIETMIGDTSCKTSDPKTKIISVLALPCQQRERKMRAKNAGEQKKTQAEVAPKNITMDTRYATETVKGRRNVNKTIRARGKRWSSKSSSKVASKRKCKVSKQQQQQQQHTDESEQGFMQSWSFEWGRKKRRQKHKRATKWWIIS